MPGMCLRRKHKARDMGDLSQCLCGDVVSQSQIGSIEVVQCKKVGCETGWVRSLALSG